MKNNVKVSILKWLVISCFLISIFILVTRICFLRLADDSVLFYVLPSETLSKFGFEKIKIKKMTANLLFSAFPSLLCPATEDFIKNNKNSGEMKVGILYALPDFPTEHPEHRVCAKNILVNILKNDEVFGSLAALDLGYFGDDAAPALVEAWNKKGDLYTKSNIAQAMIRIGSKSFVPVLTESAKRDKSFRPVLSKSDKTESVEAVYAFVALYEITNDNEYKTYITKIFKKGARASRLSAIIFMGGTPANENMIPFLRISLNDKDEAVRELAKKNIDLIENKLKVREVVPRKAI